MNVDSVHLFTGINIECIELNANGPNITKCQSVINNNSLWF